MKDAFAFFTIILLWMTPRAACSKTSLPRTLCIIHPRDAFVNPFLQVFYVCVQFFGFLCKNLRFSLDNMQERVYNACKWAKAFILTQTYRLG